VALLDFRQRRPSHSSTLRNLGSAQFPSQPCKADVVPEFFENTLYPREQGRSPVRQIASLMIQKHAFMHL
jgi:hypothetical protein